jgi:RAP domain
MTFAVRMAFLTILFFFFLSKDVSKTLNSMGISHENEKVVAGIYIADILIPSLSSIQHTNGVIVEFDGPSHFENYSRWPLGPTTMKKRHLESAGYAVKSIPYWKYDTTDTTSRKEKLLYGLLGV